MDCLTVIPLLINRKMKLAKQTTVFVFCIETINTWRKSRNFPKYTLHTPQTIHLRKHTQKTSADLLQIITLLAYRKENARNIGKIKNLSLLQILFPYPLLSHFTIKFRRYILIKYYLPIYKIAQDR